MERDIHQKMNAIKLMWNWGFLPEIEVRLFNPNGLSKAKIEFTDIDALGIRINQELTEEKIAADCKTAKQTSPINRAFWMSGLMSNLNINRGFLILSKSAETDHKLAARNLNVIIMNDEEFDKFSSSIIKKQPLNKMSLFDPEVWKSFLVKSQQVTELKDVWEYRKFRYWQDRHQKQIRYTLMEMRQASRNITQKNKIITAMFLDVMTLFSYSLTAMVSELFQTHFIFNKKSTLDYNLKLYIYDGRENYEHLNSLTKRVISLRESLLLKETGLTSLSSRETKDLELPEWDGFLHLVKIGLDNIGDFVRIPQTLRFLLFERLLTNSEVEPGEVISDFSPNLAKLCLDVLKYFSTATEMPSTIWMPIREELDKFIVNEHETYTIEDSRHVEELVTIRAKDTRGTQLALFDDADMKNKIGKSEEEN